MKDIIISDTSDHPFVSSTGRIDPDSRTVIIIFWILALMLGGLRAWATRYEIDPDTISYLDMADAYLRGDWSMALNGWWNPFYTWLLCLTHIVVKSNPYWEFPVVHLLNFAIYAAGLLCVHFLLLNMARYNKSFNTQSKWQGTVIVPDWAFFALGYVLYIYSSLYLIGFDQGADLCIANFVYLALGLLCWIGTGHSNWKPFALLGMVLGFAYLTKAIMLPLTFVFLIVGLLLDGDVRKALPKAFLALVIFIFVSSPFILALSKSKGRLTYSETGKINYAWFVSLGSRGSFSPPYFHWQGNAPNCGTPKHPTRKIFTSPDVYEFATPFQATYGAWYDPSYWYEGIVPHFNLHNQAYAILDDAIEYFNLFYHNQTGLFVGFFILSWMSWRLRHRANGIFPQWILLLPSVAALCLYGIVHVEGRYVGSYFVFIWLGLFAWVRLPDSRESRNLIIATMLGVAVVIFLFTLLPESLDDIRNMVHRRGGSDDKDVRVARGLKEMGIQPGDKIAHIGDTFMALWARLDRVHIIDEITSKDEPDYWKADAATKSRVRDAIAKTGAKAIVTDFPPKDDLDAHWQKIDGPIDQDAHYYVCFLTK